MLHFWVLSFFFPLDNPKKKKEKHDARDTLALQYSLKICYELGMLMNVYCLQTYAISLVKIDGRSINVGFFLSFQTFIDQQEKCLGMDRMLLFKLTKITIATRSMQ